MLEAWVSSQQSREDVAEGLSVRPPPFRLACPNAAQTGVIVCCPHSGRFYPEELLRVSKLDRLALRRSEDAFVDELFAAAPDLGASLLVTDYARAFVDLNRGLDELDPDLIEGVRTSGGRVPSPRVLAGLGVIPRTVGDGVEIYSRRLSQTEAQARLDEVYMPWHQAIETLIQRDMESVGQALLIDCHSMPGAASGTPENDIVLGDRFGASCAPVFMSEAFQFLRSKGLKIARNNPYAGGYATEVYGKPAQNRHSLQIEINRSLYMIEGAMTKRSGFDEVAEIMTGLVARLVQVAKSRFESLFG